MLTRWFAGIALAAALFGCAGGGGIPQSGAAPANQRHLLPQVVQKGKGAQWVEFTPHTLAALYSAIVLGADEEIWFIDEDAASLVRMSESGAIKEFRLSGPLNAGASSMAVGADKNFYVLDGTSNIVRVTPTGKTKVFTIPSGDITELSGLALGPDGNVWIAEFNHVGKITPSGKITEYSYPSGYSTNQYGGMTAGSDGNMWFAESSGNAIGKIVPKTGKITMFPISVACTPAAVVLAKDDNVWFFCLTSTPELGSITPKGKIATYSIGGVFGSNETEQFCARGPDGEPWCANGAGGDVFRVNTSKHTVTTFTPPLGPGDRPDAVAAGADGNVWVDSVGGIIDVLVFNPITITPNKLVFSAPGQVKTLTVSEHGTSSWSAKSSAPKVATVAAGGSAASFNVTSVGPGHCKITISDSTGNSVAVAVTVK